MAPGVSSFPKKVVVTRAGIFRNVMGLIAKVLTGDKTKCIKEEQLQKDR